MDAINSIVEEARLLGKTFSTARGRRPDRGPAQHGGTARSGSADPHLGRDARVQFLLWQIAYAELYVTPTLWPDFRRGDLLNAILAYQKGDGSFGYWPGAPPAAAGGTNAAAAGSAADVFERLGAGR